MTTLDKILEAHSCQDFVLIEGYDEAVVGVDAFKGVLVYSESKILDILQREYGMCREDALDFFYYNIESCLQDERYPLVMDDDWN